MLVRARVAEARAGAELAPAELMYGLWVCTGASVRRACVAAWARALVKRFLGGAEGENSGGIINGVRPARCVPAPGVMYYGVVPPVRRRLSGAGRLVRCWRDDAGERPNWQARTSCRH
jgi:hypothetical protein